MTKARDEALGPKSERSPQKPLKSTMSDNIYTGGIQFERSDQAEPVKPDTRCYTIGPSAQTQPNLVAPVRSGKIYGELDEDLMMCRHLCEVSVHGLIYMDILIDYLRQAGASCAMTSLRHGPPDAYWALQLQSDMINCPHIGTDDNFAFPTVQLNSSPAEQEGSGEPVLYVRSIEVIHQGDVTGSTLKGSLGFFGGAHTDDGDSTTCMMAHSDLPSGYHPGCFFLLELGIFVVLDNYTCINFSGLRYHGGTPPTCRGIPKKWAYRFILIWYPNNMMLNGGSLHTFAVLPHGYLFSIRPEMMSIL